MKLGLYDCRICKYRYVEISKRRDVDDRHAVCEEITIYNSNPFKKHVWAKNLKRIHGYSNEFLLNVYTTLNNTSNNKKIV